MSRHSPSSSKRAFFDGRYLTYLKTFFFTLQNFGSRCFSFFVFCDEFFLFFFSFTSSVDPIEYVQEYTEEFRDIAKGIKSKEALPAAPITLIHQRPVNEDLHVNCMFLFLFHCFYGFFH